jgi:hypothetical protein
MQHQFMSNYKRNDYLSKIEQMDPGTYTQAYNTIGAKNKTRKLGLKEVPFLKTLPVEKPKPDLT